jgi:hypothetical protein
LLFRCDVGGADSVLVDGAHALIMTRNRYICNRQIDAQHWGRTWVELHTTAWPECAQCGDKGMGCVSS